MSAAPRPAYHPPVGLPPGKRHHGGGSAWPERSVEAVHGIVLVFGLTPRPVLPRCSDAHPDRDPGGAGPNQQGALACHAFRRRYRPICERVEGKARTLRRELGPASLAISARAQDEKPGRVGGLRTCAEIPRAAERGRTTHPMAPWAGDSATPRSLQSRLSGGPQAGISRSRFETTHSRIDRVQDQVGPHPACALRRCRFSIRAPLPSGSRPSAQVVVDSRFSRTGVRFGYPGKGPIRSPRLSEVGGSPIAIRISPRCRSRRSTANGDRACSLRLAGRLGDRRPGPCSRAPQTGQAATIGRRRGSQSWRAHRRSWR